MKILSIRVLRGPNYWSYTQKKLIVIKLDLQELDKPSSMYEGFSKQLKKTLPSLFGHHCHGQEGLSFFSQLDEGILLSHVIGHVAIELQNLAGMHTTFEIEEGAREKGIYHIVFSYEVEKAALYAARAAVQVVECLAQGRQFLNLAKDIQTIQQAYDDEKLGPSTLSLVQEAEKRGIPWCKIEGQPLISFGYGTTMQKIWMTVSSRTSSIGVETAGDKNLTKQILTSHLVPTPKGHLISSPEALEEVLSFMEYPITIKPSNGNHGNGVTCNITDVEKAHSSFQLAKEFSDKVIVEDYISGSDYRFLVINFKLVAVAKRTPAHVVGTGEKTIEELINEINQDPKRGPGHDNFLTRITVDDITLAILKEQGLSLQSILDKGEIVTLKHSANISSGGTATDVTHLVHPFNRKLAERVAKIINLDICGIDAIVKNIEEPMTHRNSAIIEVNAAPGLRMHLAPSQGESKNVAAAIIDSLYPPKKKSKIPVIAVTGTNGKTTVVRLIAHLAKWCQFNVGFTTTEGIYLDDELIFKGDCSGPQSARVVLLNPNVEFAVLECARGGILRSGLGFDTCDISIITNITEDHLGLEDIHTLDDLAKVKAVVAHSTHKEGYALLNADDNLTYNLKDNLHCNIALFGIKNLEKIERHYQAGGMAAFIDEDGWLVLCIKNTKQKVALVKDIPLSFNGAAECMIKNILPAVLAGAISGFSIEEMNKALMAFILSEENTPGRMNIYQFKDFKIMLDYAHNEGGFIEIKKYLQTLDCAKKIGIISATGDRRAKDIQKIGSLSAQMFDEIIIKHDKNGRGRSNDYLTGLLLEGIHAEDSDSKVKVISDELDALNYAIEHVIPNTFIFYAVDDVFASLNHVKKK
ncbi:cyanophycin synthetase [Legionella gresilensis]|uniref:cyanophycin synthetase n=1 Tax=Legionella gresilensis TaxID=91823 RepID=UPI001040FF05|nr:cyanophycin synthetase [Legionella gresilensis]